MAFKRLRQRRYNLLISEGFLPFEAYKLSKVTFPMLKALRKDRTQTIEGISRLKGKPATKADVRLHVMVTYKNREYVDKQGKLDAYQWLIDKHGGLSGFAKHVRETNSWTPTNRDIIDDQYHLPGQKSKSHRTLRSRLDKGKVAEQRARYREKKIAERLRGR